MYITVTEDGHITAMNQITDDEKIAADEGYMDIIDTATLTHYYQNEWHPIKEWETGE